MVIGLLLMASACADTGQVKSLPDNPENRTAAAERYLKAMPPKEMLQGLAARVTSNLPEKDRAAFVEVMGSADLEKATSRITMEGLVKNFTVGELTAMTAFYGSPEGQSAAKKFGPYMAGVMPQIQQEIRKAMDEKKKQPGAQCPPEAGAPPAVPPAAPPIAKPGPPTSPPPAAMPTAPKAPPPPVVPQAAPAPKDPAASKTPVVPKAAPVPQAAPAPQAAPVPQTAPAPQSPK
jgi:hypothetical protein